MLRISVAVIATLIASGGCSGRPRSSPSASAPSSAPGTTDVRAAPCTTHQLEVSLSGDNGAAGTTYVDIVVTNTSKLICSLKGYPTVTLVDEDGDQLGKKADHNPVERVTRVTLDQGRSAHAAVDFPNPGNFPEPTPCTKAAAGMNITLPGASSPLFMSRSYAYCPGFGVSAFSGWE